MARLKLKMGPCVSSVRPRERLHGLDVPPEIHDAIELTEYAWQARYPGPGEPIGQAEYHIAVALAQKVVQWAELLVQGN